jgi:hypothetical protein
MDSFGYEYGSDNKRIQIQIEYYRIQNADTDIIRIAKQNIIIKNNNFDIS